MNKHEQCLVAEYSSIAEADVGCKVLETADFTDDTVSVVARSSEETVESAGNLKDQTAASPPETESVAVGGVVGGSVGMALGTATLIGPLMVAGPLVGIALGAGTASAIAATDRWGVTRDKTEDYEQRVEAGSVLVIVNGKEIRLDEAERLLQTTGPKSMNRFGGA